ncbi:TetR/AcrR family transcriptional regulator [Microbacterium rhizophilus]|uniref:TetR/AcrR family transcriptional regulator n=1 Tax=Microbacterium rhizophilus TaxID=3138934 RepID=UPI0031E53A39
MDPRVARTRAALVDAALETLESAPVADLTVAALCAKAGVSRVAFYDRFGSIDALLVAAMEAELDRVREAAAAIDPGGDRAEDEPPADLVEVFRIIGQHAGLYRAMLAETGSMAFLHRMRDALRVAVRASMHRLPGSAEWPVAHETYYDYIAGAVVSVVIGWLSADDRRRGDDIARELWWLIAHRPDALLAAGARP